MKLSQRNDAWKVLGPGGGGGQFNVVISPHDPLTMVINCDMTGFYITYDGGASWRMINLRTGIGPKAFCPVNPKRIYAGGSALWRSDDGGNIWHMLFPDPAKVTNEIKVGDHSGARFVGDPAFTGGGISAIAADPADPSTVACGVGPAFRQERVARLFLSHDDGATFTQVGQVPGAGILQIVFTAPGSGFAATTRGLFAFSKNSFMAIESPVESFSDMQLGREGDAWVVYAVARDQSPECSGIYRGDTKGGWQMLTPYPDGGPDVNVHHIPSFRNLAVCAQKANCLYLSAFDYPISGPNDADGSCHRDMGIMKSADGGKTWDWAYHIGFLEEATNRDYGWCDIDPHNDKLWGWQFDGLTLSVSPTDPDHVLTTDYGTTLQSRDGGAFWRQCYTNMLPDGSCTSNGMDVTTCYGVHFDPFDPNHIAVSYTDIGLFHSRDGGQTWWQSMEGVVRHAWNTCYWVLFDPDVQGKAWSVWSSAHDLPRPKMYRGGHHHKARGGLSVTTNGMNTWTTCMNGIPKNVVFTDIILDPKSSPASRTLYAAGFSGELGGVYRSDNGGKSWVCCNEGINDNRNIFRLALSEQGDLYAVVARGMKHGEEFPGALYVSHDKGETFEKLLLPEVITSPNDLKIDVHGRLYLCCWPWVGEGTEHGGGTWASDDKGKTWQCIHSEHAHDYALDIDPRDPNVLYICGFDHVVDRSEDRGKTWKPVRGYNFHWGQRPVVDIHNPDNLYVTTFGGSVWHGPAKGDPQAACDTPDYPFLRGASDL